MSPGENLPARKGQPRRWLGVRPGLWAALFAVVALFVIGLLACTWMPGRSWRGPLPPADAEATALSAALAHDVRELAEEIGERNYLHAVELERAARFIESSLSSAGLVVERQEFEARGQKFVNVAAELPARAASREIVLVGAHYDTALGSPGANDNASGVAALLVLARRLAPERFERRLRFVAFANEEPPFFQSDGMGSVSYARACRERGEAIVAMLSLETLGCYSDTEGSQRYPLAPIGWLYPSRGDFVAFVGDTSARSLVRTVIGAFREHASFPSEGAALPDSIPGVGWSDHWAFSREGCPALMVTDTALFRDPAYHTHGDTHEHVDTQRLALVVLGLEAVLRELGNAPQPAGF